MNLVHSHSLALLPFLLSLMYWISDGSRMAFWATSIAIQEEIPIVEGMPELGTQTKITWLDQFVCGIETPIAGFFLSAFFLFIKIYRKRSLKNFSATVE